jgi:hypothetical protein
MVWKARTDVQRLISFFHKPHDDWPQNDWTDPAGVDAPPPHPGDDEGAPPLNVAPKEPLYFAELMAYVRERNEKSRWPREGAD